MGLHKNSLKTEVPFSTLFSYKEDFQNPFLFGEILKGQANQAQLRLTKEDLDRVFVEKLSKMEHVETLRYLFDCYARCGKQKTEALNKSNAVRQNFLEDLKKMIILYSGLALMYPEMFEQKA